MNEYNMTFGEALVQLEQGQTVARRTIDSGLTSIGFDQILFRMDGQKIMMAVANSEKKAFGTHPTEMPTGWMPQVDSATQLLEHNYKLITTPYEGMLITDLAK